MYHLLGRTTRRKCFWTGHRRGNETQCSTLRCTPTVERPTREPDAEEERCLMDTNAPRDVTTTSQARGSWQDIHSARVPTTVGGCGWPNKPQHAHGVQRPHWSTPTAYFTTFFFFFHFFMFSYFFHSPYFSFLPEALLHFVIVGYQHSRNTFTLSSTLTCERLLNQKQKTLKPKSRLWVGPGQPHSGQQV